jgi:ribonuclease BN (tRNA processing enzyme)
MDTARVRFLGTGDPFASGERLQTCILLESDNGRTLIDCGMTAMVSLARFGIDPGTVDTILVTHLHGDHFGGLAPFILEAQFNAREGGNFPARTRALCIAGPADTEDRVRRVLDLFGWRGHVAAMKDAGLLDFTTLEPRRETTLGQLTVTAFPVVHTLEATALRVVCAGKIVAYSGDAEWTDVLLDVAADADLFICQAYAFDRPQQGLLNYRTLMEHRGDLTCRRLILTHIGPEMQSRLAAAAEAVAEDGTTIVL